MSQDVATPRALPTRAAAIFGGLLVVGAITFLLGASSSDGEVAKRAYRAFLQNWLIWAALSKGALMLSAAMRLTNARWPGPIQRSATRSARSCRSRSCSSWSCTGRHELFEWTEHPVAGKEWWYEPGFMFARDLGGAASGWPSSRPSTCTCRAPDARARARSATGLRGTLNQRWTAGWRGEERERDLAVRRSRKLAAVLALSYAFCVLDDRRRLVMSLAPTG